MQNGAFLCIFARFLHFFVRFCAFFPAKMACIKAQICTEACKNVQKALLCNTPFSYTPFCVSPTNFITCERFAPIASNLRFAIFLGRSKWGLSNGGLRPLSAVCAQSSTIVHFCGLFGLLSKGNFRHTK